MKVIIVCHTEFGFVSDEKEIIFDKNATRGVTRGIINLIKLANKYGAKITFTVCPEVVKFFPKNINQEIGLHLHPGWEEFKNKKFRWQVGDQYLKECCQFSQNSTALRDYSYSEQLEMIRVGKEYLEKELKVKPKVFVAGRGSLNDNTIRALIENNFTHDCSAVANTKLNYLDWSKLPRICLPYRPSKNDYQKKGNLPILIMPVSQTIFRKPVSPESVLIYGTPWLKACFSEYYKQNVPLFQISLHSPTMTDSFYLGIMDNFLSFIAKHQNINFKFASEIKEYPQQNFKTDILPYLLALNKEITKTIIRKLIK